MPRFNDFYGDRYLRFTPDEMRAMGEQPAPPPHRDDDFAAPDWVLVMFLVLIVSLGLVGLMQIHPPRETANKVIQQQAPQKRYVAPVMRPHPVPQQRHVTPARRPQVKPPKKHTTMSEIARSYSEKINKQTRREPPRRPVITSSWKREWVKSGGDLWDSPNVGGRVIGRIESGSYIQYQEFGQGWYRVITEDGKHGFTGLLF